MPLNLQAIKERADKASQGPWKVGKASPNGSQNVGTVNGMLTAQTTDENNAEFIANAPLDIKMLIAEIELEQKHRLNAMDLIAKLRQEKEQLREALEFYADEKNHTEPRGTQIFGDVFYDKGKIARKALDGEK